MIKRYFKRLKTEFKGYNAGKFGKDVLAGITVAAVALPLALAFGISKRTAKCNENVICYVCCEVVLCQWMKERLRNKIRSL